MKKTEHIEELLSHHAEDELDATEVAELEAFLATHPDQSAELDFERAVMQKLRSLPCEEAPADFASQVMAAAPPLPGGWMHRAELALRRLLLPGLVTAGALAASLLLVPQGPDLFPEHAPRGAPRQVMQVAQVMAGPGGATLGQLELQPGDLRPVRQGQRLRVPEGSSAHLQIADGVEVEVASRSELTLDYRMVFLDEGKVHARVRPGIGNFVVHAPQASAWVVGTEFSVSSDAGTAVEVLKGIVEVRTRSGDQRTQLLPGGQALVRASQPTHLEIQGAHQDAREPLQVAAPDEGGPIEAEAGKSGAQAESPEGLPSLDSN